MARKDEARDARSSDATLRPESINSTKEHETISTEEHDREARSPSESYDVEKNHEEIRHPPSNQDNKSIHNPRKQAVKVTRRQRRGLLSQLTLVPEVTQPQDYSNAIKWLLTAIVGFAAAAAPVGSAIIFPVLDHVADELHSTPEITNLSVALYMLAMGLFPLWWSSFSEAFGRRNVYLISFALYAIFSALAALAKSVSTLIIFRLLSGGAAASVQAVGAGTIADCWAPFERGRAMAYFYLGPLLGPLLGPIIGGALGQTLGWRSTQWAQTVFGGFVWIMLLFALPETLAAKRDVVARAEEEAEATPDDTTARPEISRTTTRQSVHQKSVKWVKAFRMMFIDPFTVVLYLQYMPVLLTVYYAAVTFSTLYILNISIQYTFEKPPYEFSTIVLGLLYIPNSLGYVLSSLLGGPWIDRIMAREARRANRYDEGGKLILLPEDRMRENAWAGAIIYPCALIWYGWSAEKGTFWLVPMIANFFYGVGSMLIFTMATTMLTEFMPKKSSSGVALNNLVRNTLCSIGAVAGVPVIKAIGNGWLFTILGIWAASSSVVVWAMRRFGPRWRKHMQEAFDQAK